MAGKSIRYRVTAEITLAHILELAAQDGFPVTRDAAFAFLNENGHAYEMWIDMMQAGEEFIKRNLMRSPLESAAQDARTTSLS
jgi:hypothetical protein